MQHKATRATWGHRVRCFPAAYGADIAFDRVGSYLLGAKSRS